MAEAPGFGGLAGLSEELQEEQNAKDPVMRMAIAQGLREQQTARQEQVEQAAGLSGAAQVAQSNAQNARSFFDAIRAGIEAERGNRQANLQMRLGAESQLAQMRQSAYEFDRNLEFQLMMQKRQEDAMLKQAVIGGVAGMASAGIGGYFDFLGAGKGDD
jgi:hypothetical protein